MGDLQDMADQILAREERGGREKTAVLSRDRILEDYHGLDLVTPEGDNIHLSRMLVEHPDLMEGYVMGLLCQLGRCQSKFPHDYRRSLKKAYSLPTF